MENLEYKKHYFINSNVNEVKKITIKSFDDYFCNNLTLNFNYKSLSDHIIISSMNCRNLLHDDFWVKITSKNNKFDKIEDLQELNIMDDNSIAFVNTINSDDISNINFLQFVDKINNSKFNGYSIEFRYIDLDEDTDNIKWIIIYCRKDDSK